MLRQNNFGAQAGTVGTILTLAYAVEPVAGGDYLRAGGRTIQIFAEMLEYCGMFGWNCRKVIECFIDASRQACGRHVMAQYALIHHLSKETRLGSQLLEHKRNIFLSFGGERLLIPSSSAKGDDNDFALLCRSLSMHKWAAAHQGSSERQSGGTAQKVASAATKMPGKLIWRGYQRFE